MATSRRFYHSFPVAAQVYAVLRGVDDSRSCYLLRLRHDPSGAQVIMVPEKPMPVVNDAFYLVEGGDFGNPTALNGRHLRLLPTLPHADAKLHLGFADTKNMLAYFNTYDLVIAGEGVYELDYGSYKRTPYQVWQAEASATTPYLMISTGHRVTGYLHGDRFLILEGAAP